MDDDGPTRARRGLIAEVTAPAGYRPGAVGLGRWLARAAPAGARGTVSIALVSDVAMRRLNRQYRGIDRATDVLSFPGPTSGVTPEVGRISATSRSPSASRGVRPSRTATRCGPSSGPSRCMASCTCWATTTKPIAVRCGRSKTVCDHAPDCVRA